MALKPGQMRAFSAIRREAEGTVTLLPDRFQEMFYSSEKKAAFMRQYAALLAEHLGRVNPFKGDTTVEQAYYEPKNWCQPLAAQLDLLGVFFPGASVDADYMQQRQRDPAVDRFVRVAFPKIAFYERNFALANGYKEIGVPIEHICDMIGEQRRGKFTNWRKGELGPNHVYFHPETEEQRREMEKGIPGDIMIIDIDTANWALGQGKTCHSPRWSREEVLMGDKLFSLSATDAGVVLLTNPKRIQRFEDLSIDAVAEVYVLDGPPSYSLCFDFVVEKLRFVYGDGWFASSRSAAAVGLRPGVSGLS